MARTHSLRVRRGSFTLVVAIVLASVLAPAPAIASGHLIAFATTSHYNNFTRIDVTFSGAAYSENNQTGALAPTDFVHTGTANIQSVTHTAGNNTAVIVMDGPVQQGDTLAAAANQIFNQAGAASATDAVPVILDQDWVDCNASVGGQTITTQCIAAFEQDGDPPVSPNLKPSIFEAADLLQIQVWDQSRLGQNPDQSELVGDGGLLTADSEVHINLDLGSFDPTVLIGTADLLSYTTSAPGASSHTLDMVVKPKGFAFKSGCGTQTAAGCAGNADIDYEGSLSLASIPADLFAGEAAFAAAVRGMTIMTGAQEFAFPSWDPVQEALAIQVAAPSNLSDGSQNVGFFEAFIPNGLFGEDFFNIDPNDAAFSATSDGNGVTASATVVAGGVKVSLTGLTFSAPTILIHADQAPPQPADPQPPPPDLSEGVEVDAGETVTTDPEGTGPTADSPVQASVTTPVAGTVRVVVDEAGEGDDPEGFSLFGQQVTISAPVSTPENPLELEFEVHDSQVPEGVALDDVVVFRNGEPVPECTGATGVADPDPCVAEREAGANGLALTVLTSQASTWRFGLAAPPPPPDEFHDRRIGLRQLVTSNPYTLAVRGRVFAPTSSRCRRNALVKFQQRRKGRWVTLSLTTTNRRGVYRTPANNVPGLYRAVATRAVKSDADGTKHICRRAVSPVRRVADS